MQWSCLLFLGAFQGILTGWEVVMEVGRRKSGHVLLFPDIVTAGRTFLFGM